MSVGGRSTETETASKKSDYEELERSLNDVPIGRQALLSKTGMMDHRPWVYNSGNKPERVLESGLCLALPLQVCESSMKRVGGGFKHIFIRIEREENSQEERI